MRTLTILIIELILISSSIYFKQHFEHHHYHMIFEFCSKALEITAILIPFDAWIKPWIEKSKYKNEEDMYK